MASAQNQNINFTVSGVGQTISGINAVASAVQGIGTGNIGAIGTGVGAIGRLGGFTSALGIAVTALGALATATKGAADALARFGRLRDTLGSSSSQAALATVLAGSLGISDVRGLAARARAGSSSGMGAVQLAQIGIGPQMDLGRPVNEGRILLAIMQDIRNTYLRLGRDAALLRARNYGIEELVELGTLSKKEFAAALEEAKEIERTYTPERIQKAREFNRELGRMERNFERLKIGAGSAVLPPLNRILEDPLAPLKALLPGGLSGMLFPKAGGAADKALNENTKATRDLVDELRDATKQGIFGGGARARSAIPGAFGPGGGFQVAKQMRAHAIRLGVHAISL